MLEHVDSTLEAFFRATVPLSALDVDVSFEPPDREWSAKLTRPTVSLFLWDIRRSTARAQSGVEELEREGRLVRRAPLPRVELRFLATAWTADHGDERALLAGVMRAILAHSDVPSSFVAEPLQELPPITLLMARAGDEQPDVGALLDGQLKPGISMTVVTAVDTDVFTPAGPPVDVFELAMATRSGVIDPSLGVRRIAGEITRPDAIGATVLSPHGTATVNGAGRFVVRAVAGDEIVVSTDPPVTVIVPLEGGVRVS
ncbi:MAG: Pvc16 family protein [Ilumatobacteraceae bacterium]